MSIGEPLFKVGDAVRSDQYTGPVMKIERFVRDAITGELTKRVICTWEDSNGVRHEQQQHIDYLVHHQGDDRL